MKNYNFSDFESLQLVATRSNKVLLATKKESNELFYIKDMLPNQFINLIIANPIFRKSLGEDLIPEVEILIDYDSIKPKYFSVIKKVNLTSALNLPHMAYAYSCSGSGWGFGCTIINPNIGASNPNCINAEKGGIATILFQDSDHHIDNEAYIKQNDKYSYIRIDVDHSDMVFTPLLDHIIELPETLHYYNFTCNSLKILAEFIAQREEFKQSVSQSLYDIAKIFSDDDIHRIYQGLERFKAPYDTSEYYHPIDFTGNEDFGVFVLNNFDLIFDHAQKQLTEIKKNHSFELGGIICNLPEEL